MSSGTWAAARSRPSARRRTRAGARRRPCAGRPPPRAARSRRGPCSGWRRSRGRRGGPTVPGKPVDDRVRQLDGVVDQPVRVEALGGEPRLLVRVEQHAELRRVDLHVVGAEPGQLGDLVPQQPGDVLEVGLRRGVGAVGDPGRPVVGVHRRGGHGRLHRLRGARAEVGELVGAEEPPPPDPPGDRDRDRAPLHRAVEPEPVHLVPLDRLEPVRGLDDLAGEDVPPLLAVGEDVDPGALLERDRLVDGAVLDLPEPVVGELAACVPLAGVEQVRRAGSRLPTFSRAVDGHLR